LDITKRERFIEPEFKSSNPLGMNQSLVETEVLATLSLVSTTTGLALLPYDDTTHRFP